MKKRIIATVLTMAMVMTGCGSTIETVENVSTTDAIEVVEESTVEVVEESIESTASEGTNGRVTVNAVAHESNSKHKDALARKAAEAEAAEAEETETSKETETASKTETTSKTEKTQTASNHTNTTSGTQTETTISETKAVAQETVNTETVTETPVVTTCSHENAYMAALPHFETVYTNGRCGYEESWGNYYCPDCKSDIQYMYSKVDHHTLFVVTPGYWIQEGSCTEDRIYVTDYEACDCGAKSEGGETKTNTAPGHHYNTRYTGNYRVEEGGSQREVEVYCQCGDIKETYWQ